MPKPGNSLVTLFTLIIFSGCTVGPDYVRPPAAVPSAYKEARGWKQATPRDKVLPVKWWRIFNDPQLNALEEQVNLNNQTLAQAEAQYFQAQALVQSAWANYLPTGGASATVNRFKAAGGQNVVVPGVRNLFNVALNATWEPDIWGAVRRQVESNVASAQASAGSYQALRLSIQATLAQNYFQLRGLDAQKKVLDATVDAYQKTVELTRNRYESGVVAKTDVVQAETQLQSAKAQSIHIGVTRTQLQHAIAVLSGQLPEKLTIASQPLTAEPPVIPPNIPSALLERRPDIAAAERQMAAANAKIGVAKAAYFPALTLSASSGLQSYNLTSLFNMARRYWALGPASLAYTLFDGGARSAQMKQAIDLFDASVASYRQTVLTAFQEVEDQLAAIRILEDEYQEQKQAKLSAEKALEMTNNQYKAGIVNFINVMIQQSSTLANENALVQILSNRMVATVLLVKALGGGWEISGLPTTEEAGGKVEWYEYFPIPIEQNR